MKSPLATWPQIAPGNAVSSFGIGPDELVVAMCVDAADCFALKAADMSLDDVVKLAFFCGQSYRQRGELLRH